MLDIREIFVSEILYADNANELFQEYTDESMVETLQAQPKPDEDKYLDMEHKGILRCVGIFDKDTLVGFAVAKIDTLNHHSLPIGLMDSIFVMKPYRKNGTAKRLLEKMEELLRISNCISVVVAGPSGSTMCRFVEMYGYKPTNVIYSKSLL